jgi:hypothetical protein
MSRISKKKLIKVLKGDLEEHPWNQETLSEYLAKPITQEEWLKGYHKWKKQLGQNNVND